MLEADVGDALELLAGEDLADGVVWEYVRNRGESRGKGDIRGVLRTSILVRGVMARSSSSKSMDHSPAERVLTAPSLGGCSGT